MKEQPFFLFLHTFMIHDYCPPRKWAEIFNKGCESSISISWKSQFKLTLDTFNDEGEAHRDLAQVQQQLKKIEEF
jgi:hypothetical protein